MSSSYETWLERQSEILQKGIELIKTFGFKAVIIDEKPSFIRIYLLNQYLNFYVKEIKTEFVRSIWLCKKEQFNPKNYYLIYANKEEKWLACSGYEIEKQIEYRESEYNSNIKYLVVPIDLFRSAISLLKSIKKRYEERVQKRMIDWI